MVATKRIVVLVTEQDKKEIVAKAKRLSMSVAELMRRGAFAYEPDSWSMELDALMDAVGNAARRFCDAIDDALAYVEQSNARIAAMESVALRR